MTGSVKVHIEDDSVDDFAFKRAVGSRAPPGGQRKAGTACELRLISVDDVTEVFKVATLIHCHYMDPSVRPDPSEEDIFIRDPDYSGKF